IFIAVIIISNQEVGKNGFLSRVSCNLRNEIIGRSTRCDAGCVLDRTNKTKTREASSFQLALDDFVEDTHSEVVITQPLLIINGCGSRSPYATKRCAGK